MTNAEAPSSSRSAHFIFILLFLLYMFDYIDRLVVVSLFPYIKADWGLSDARLGLLISAVYWAILVLTLPVSVLVDRWSRTKSIGWMSVVWSLGTLACAMTRGFSQLFAARAVIGVGQAGFAPGGSAMISALFPEERRARMLGLWNASIPLGSAIGVGVGGIIAQHYGWRAAFWLTALPGLLIALAFFRMRDYQTVALVKTDPLGGIGRDMARRELVTEFAHKPSLILNNLAMAANVFVTTSLMTWLPTYFHRLYDTDMTRAGVQGGLVMLMAFVGAPLGGMLADWRYDTRKESRMRFAAWSSLATGVLLIVAFAWLRGPAQYVVLLASGVTAVGFVPAAVAVTQDVVHPGLRAVSVSLNVIIQHVLGSSVGPPVIGALSDAWGLANAVMFIPILCGLAAVLYLIGSRYYASDLAKVDRVPVKV
jgi:predicted MFS family arabinose efflux permease